MGQLKTFEILINNADCTVESGNTLKGQLVIENSSDIGIKSISVQCFGKCHVQWMDAKNAAPLAEIQIGVSPTTTGDEVYMHDAKVVFPPDVRSNHDFSSTHILKKGQHTFPFAFPVPATAPSSYTSENGYVKYVVRAAIERLWKTESNVRTFNVRSPLDLSEVTDAQNPIEVSGEAMVTPLFRRPGVCAASIKVDRKGFLPGETVPVAVNVTNDSGLEIKHACLVLKMITDYKSGIFKHKVDKVIAKTRVDKVSAGGQLDSVYNGLKIPHNSPPSHLHGCKYIHVRYVVELHVKPGVLSVKKLKIGGKLVVGTTHRRIPFGVGLHRVFEPPPSYDDIPPSYEEAMRNRVNAVPETISACQSTPAPQSTTNTAATRQSRIPSMLPETPVGQYRSNSLRISVLKRNLLNRSLSVPPSLSSSKSNEAVPHEMRNLLCRN
ncbi:arrestin domain-containing protein 2 [Aplysia californica]|uniref:Arrestin domain-containing protein 2 n=1 Tax=Aplysia californica TaxID=6500 RepID=A0ABM0JK00_APLCA|nr:arrestin domain-containing protein 2 [Aplysia californica]